MQPQMRVIMEQSLLPIQQIIYEVRGKRVILDHDLAVLYHVETRVLNQAVKRNIDRFPVDFMFQLTADEWQYMSSQFVMTSMAKRPKSSLPYAFTEYGVVMLASVLRSDVAMKVSVLITRAFIEMRQTLLTIATTDVKLNILEKKIDSLNEYVNDILRDQNDINEETSMQLELINESLAELQNQRKLLDKPRNPIGFR